MVALLNSKQRELVDNCKSIMNKKTLKKKKEPNKDLSINVCLRVACLVRQVSLVPSVQV